MVHKNILFLVAALSFFATSCAQLPRRNGEAPPSQSTEPVPSPSPQEGPDSKAEQVKARLGVILGPGGYKAFAHAGVLRELEKAQIPVQMIVGLEWGSLVAGLYAAKGKAHEVDWRLYKLQNVELQKKKFFGKEHEPIQVSRLEEYFKANVGEIQISDLEIPFACPTVSLWSGTHIWQQAGPVVKALEKCLPYPPLFKPKSPYMAGAFAEEEAVALLQKSNCDVILFVNVLDKGDLMGQEELLEQYTSAMLWHELRRHLQDQKKSLKVEWIDVNTRQFKLYDLKNLRALIKAGEAAGALAADQLVERHDF